MLLTGLLLGAALGYALQRSRFCVTTAFRDVFVARSTRWLTAFLLVIAVHALGLAILQTAGVVPAPSEPLALPATAVGALIFGVAIVLAAGCATGTYFRAGEGLVGSWIALAAYAVSAGAMKYGPLAELTGWARSATVPATTIHGTLGLSPWVLVVVLGAGVALLVHRNVSAAPRLAVATLPPRRTGLAHLLAERSWGAYPTAVGIGVLATIAWPLSIATGRESGLGITTPSANLATYLVTADPQLVDWGVFLVLGILLGSFVAAKASGEFRVRVPDATQATRSVVGGVGMGVGASLAGGCTIGNAMVETAQFTYQGWLSFALMLLGAGLGTRWFVLHGPRTAARTVATTSPTTTATA
ncbi:YeeE/YedE family protein [Georgenia alba]|uniref:YeeE/YedE family protein n=1 Tax=Georgenia alba TaxID=2233858 RepID=A0ABW2QBE8_9MICO